MNTAPCTVCSNDTVVVDEGVAPICRHCTLMLGSEFVALVHSPEHVAFVRRDRAHSLGLELPPDTLVAYCSRNVYDHLVRIAYSIAVQSAKTTVH